MPSVGPGTGARLWTPLDGGVSGRLVGWWDFSDDLMVVGPPTGVTGLRDKSLQRNDLTAVSTPTRTATIGRLPAITTGGVSSSRFTCATNPLTGATGGTVFYIAARTAGATQWAAPVNGPGGGQDSWYTYGGDRYEYFGTSVRKSWANAATLTVPHVASIVSASGFYDVRHQGASVYSTGTNTFDASSSMIVGYNGAGGGFFSGETGEIVMYSGALTLTDRVMVERYLSAKFGIPLAQGACSPPLVFA